jgi:hypothetical protein
MDIRMGSNINGPSLIRVPEWVEDPLGKYYLYFGHHQGKYIRLAYADNLEGPWSTYKPGVLDLENAYCTSHIASPDVHIFDESREIRMYYHGPVPERLQQAKVARSQDGLSFTAMPENLGNYYFRVFYWNGYTYALGMPGIIYRSRDGLTGFEEGPTLFTEDMRHTALKLDGKILTVYYSNAFDCPERILSSTIDISLDWMNWTNTEPEVILEPETDYEGAELPLEPSARGSVHERVRQLRDPGIYREGDETYLLYSVAGESGIAIARFTA